MAEKGSKIWIDEDKVSVNTYDEAMKVSKRLRIKSMRVVRRKWLKAITAAAVTIATNKLS